MSTNASAFQERIDGPFLGRDRYGEIDHTYWQCSACGAESVYRGDLLDCCGAQP